MSPHTVNVTIQSLYSVLPYAWIKDSSVLLSRYAGVYLTTNAGKIQNNNNLFLLSFLSFLPSLRLEQDPKRATQESERAQKSHHLLNPVMLVIQAEYEARRENFHQLWGLMFPFCACVCVCVWERESMRLVGDFRLITLLWQRSKNENKKRLINVLNELEFFTHTHAHMHCIYQTRQMVLCSPLSPSGFIYYITFSSKTETCLSQLSIFLKAAAVCF